MSGAATLRVTPAELVGVATQVRALAWGALTGSTGVRTAAANVEPPDPAADQFLTASARGTHAALGEVAEMVGSLLVQLGRELDRQAAALLGAAHGYAYVERQVGAAFDPPEPRHE